MVKSGSVFVCAVCDSVNVIGDLDSVDNSTHFIDVGEKFHSFGPLCTECKDLIEDVVCKIIDTRKSLN
jgi:hypothetical protein